MRTNPRLPQRQQLQQAQQRLKKQQDSLAALASMYGDSSSSDDDQPEQEAKESMKKEDEEEQQQEQQEQQREKEEKNKSKMCEVCGEQEFKYTCPRLDCNAQTCSLACVKRHKTQSGCDGKSNPASTFVPMSEFTDTHLHRDLHFLNRVLQETERTSRIAARKVPSSAPGTMPQRVRLLVRQAASRGITVRVMPKGMQRRLQNATRFVSKRKTIMWRVDVLFPDAPNPNAVVEFVQKQAIMSVSTDDGDDDADQRLVVRAPNFNKMLRAVPTASATKEEEEQQQQDEQETTESNHHRKTKRNVRSVRKAQLMNLQYNENLTWAQVLESKLSRGSLETAPLRSQLKAYASAFDDYIQPVLEAAAAEVDEEKKQAMIDECEGAIGLFMRNPDSSAASPKYWRLPMFASIRDSLRGTTIIEYPTVFVVLSSSFSKYP
eukprot:TRINITY_DN65842_c2_g1_i1.p1 TRINITY_DN65842_c2_g1~~TRINITY_DN65842_c2_g1_i1.p1  ORF type:complete len:469 (-),score=218.67 TRINITY_DN65842_c2_g1_i1:35-1336(-)